VARLRIPGALELILATTTSILGTPEQRPTDIATYREPEDKLGAEDQEYVEDVVRIDSFGIQYITHAEVE
jgi:hypothetical protein